MTIKRGFKSTSGINIAYIKKSFQWFYRLIHGTEDKKHNNYCRVNLNLSMQE